MKPFIALFILLALAGCKDRTSALASEAGTDTSCNALIKRAITAFNSWNGEAEGRVSDEEPTFVETRRHEIEADGDLGVVEVKVYNHFSKHRYSKEYFQVETSTSDTGTCRIHSIRYEGSSQR